MDPAQITALAKLLKTSGDKVLNSQFKLSLSGSLLRALNDSFSLIVDKNEILPPQSFQVVKPNNAKSDVFRDLQFVYDFVQKTVILSLNHFVNDDPYEFAVDISKFRSLRTLEVQKISIKQIVGIQHLRSQLEELTCMRSISDVTDVLLSCGGDKVSESKQWRSLKSLNFAYNMLDYVDSSLDFAPWLEVLNLSHNELVNVSAIRSLPNLRTLNLSFNRLNQIPAFHADAMRKLRVLQISNNFLEDLDGLACLSCSLNELDLSGNFIVDHGALLPLSTLIVLRSVNLLDNPLACHPKHRHATARYLNKAASEAKFILDNEQLSRYERTLTGNYDSYKAILVPNAISTASLHSSGQNTPALTTSVFAADGDGNVTSGSFKGTMNEKDVMNQSVISQKKLRVRRAVISESDNEDLTMKYATADVNKTISSVNLESNLEHLETKKALENLRSQYGSEWLQSQAGHMVKNVIGFDPNTEKEYESVVHYQNTMGSNQNIKDHTSEHIIPIDQPDPQMQTEVQRTSTPIGDEQILFQIKTTQVSPVGQGELSETKTTLSDYKSAFSDDNNTRYVSLEQEIIASSMKGSLNLTDIYKNREEVDEESEAEENEILYHVSTHDGGTDFSIVVSDKSIKEKDVIGKTKTRWGIKTLEACERSTSSRITLTFDTMKRDKRERVYEMDAHDCQLLENRLRDILSQRPLSEMNQRLYKCVVCNAKFSREVNTKRIFEDLQCPECYGGYCIEIREQQLEKDTKSVIAGSSEISKAFVQSVLASNSNVESAVPGTSGTNILEPATIQHSASKNSIESTESFNDSSSVSRISQPGSSCDSNQSVAGSTNSERDRDTDLLGNESDIEVLSNPSQSSIEVLDRGYHPSRKASEERRVSGHENINDGSEKYMGQEAVTSLNVGQEALDDHKGANLDGNLDETMKHSFVASSKESTSTKEDLLVTKGTSVSKYHTSHANKKMFLTNVNLTESSSSGSVTDSVCTAYESSQGMTSDVSISKQTAKELEVTTIEQASSHELHPEDYKELVENVPAGVVCTGKADGSVLTSVLGGLFQSTNMLMAKNPKGKSDENSMNKFYEPIRYNFNDFANVDHRLKLYLYQTLFEDTHESLKWLVSCIVFDDNHADEWPSGFDGLFIMSTTKFYVMKKVAAENDDPSTWLKKYIAGTIERVGIAQSLPWKIGIKFIISAIGGVHIILQDILRTDKLMLFFNENPLPHYCTLDYQSSDLLNGKLKKVTKGEQVKIVMIINFCDVLLNDELESVQLSTLLVTENKLMLAPDIKWLNESSAYPIEPKFSQLMTNIVELEDVNELSCRLNFMDEQEDKYETWRLDFATTTAKESTVGTICHLWENIFGVPLVNEKASVVSNVSTTGDDNNGKRTEQQK